MPCLLPSRLLEVKINVIGFFVLCTFLGDYLHLCLPNFQVTVHKISEISNVMIENRIQVLICSDTSALKSQPCAEWEKVPCAEEKREPSTGSKSPPARCSSPPRVPWRNLVAAATVVHAQHHFFPGSLWWAVCVHLQASSSDYCGLYCNPLIASHFWCQCIVIVGQILCFVSSIPTLPVGWCNRLCLVKLIVWP